MIAIDVSLLAYAVNRYAPEHGRAATVLETLVNGETPWALPWPVVHEFIGLVTHPHRVARVLRPLDAWGFVDEVLASPSVRALSPGEQHGAVMAELLQAAAAAALPGPGFELAVVLREHGVRELLSSDRGMRRFPFLLVTDPIHGEPWSPDTPPQRRYRRLTLPGSAPATPPATRPRARR